MSSIFRDLHDAFQPIYALESAPDDSWCRYLDTLPRNLLRPDGEGLLTADGHHLSRRAVYWDVREDGPGAWGCGLTLRANELFRWNPGDSADRYWYLATQDHYITVESGGNVLEVISLNEPATWVRNVFCSI